MKMSNASNPRAAFARQYKNRDRGIRTDNDVRSEQSNGTNSQSTTASSSSSSSQSQSSDTKKKSRSARYMLKMGRGKEKAKMSKAQVKQTFARLKENQRRLDGHQERRETMQRESLRRDSLRREQFAEMTTADLGASRNLLSILEDTDRTDIEANDEKLKQHDLTLQKLKKMETNLDRLSECATDEFHTEELSEAEEMCDLVASLHVTNRQNQEMIKSLHRRMSEMETKYETKLEQSHSEQASENDQELQRVKKQLAKVENKYYNLAGRVATKAQEQIASHSLEKEIEVDQWREKHDRIDQSYEELVQKVEELAIENGDLHAKCQFLEENESTLKEEMGAMEELQSENEALHESIQAMEEAMQFASGMSERMEVFVEAHEADVAGYENKLAALNMEKMRAVVKCRVLQRELDQLKGGGG